MGASRIGQVSNYCLNGNSKMLLRDEQGAVNVSDEKSIAKETKRGKLTSHTVHDKTLARPQILDQLSAVRNRDDIVSGTMQHEYPVAADAVAELAQLRGGLAVPAGGDHLQQEAVFGEAAVAIALLGDLAGREPGVVALEAAVRPAAAAEGRAAARDRLVG